MLARPAGLLDIPLFLAGLLVVRAVPSTLYVRDFGWRRAAVAGLLQATSLPFIVAATQMGTALALLQRSTATALVAAGLLSVVAFPLLALALTGPPGHGADEPILQGKAPHPATEADDGTRP